MKKLTAEVYAMKVQDLSVSERVLLAQQLWDSVFLEQNSIPVTSEQNSILDARLATFEVDGDMGSSWQQVKKRILDGK
jgi:putative addiction module component (TIGR02574 family)